MPLNKQERLLCYNGELLVFHLYKGDFENNRPANGSILHVRRNVFESQTKTFVLKSTGFFNMKENYSHLKILSCNSVSDFRTGINLPCILIQNTKNNSVFNYYLLLLHSTNKFEKCLSFELSYELKDDIRVVNGPLVFWQHVKTFFYVSCQIGKVTNVSLNFSSIKWIGEIENHGIVLLGPTEQFFETGATTQSSISDYAICNTKFCAYALESQEIVSDSYIIPSIYSSVVMHVHVCTTEIVNHQLRISLIVLTQKNQLIFFQNGTPKGVCQLPFLDPCAVQVLDSGKGTLFFIVSFRSDHACAVSEKSFKVVAKWEKLRLVLIDDFTGAGTEQVLLLFTDSLSSDPLMSFKITDLVKYSSDPLDYKDEEVDYQHKNCYLVVLPLETKCKDEFTFIRRIKQHLLLKESVIAKSWKALVNLIQGKNDSTSNEEESLVPLFDEEENCAHTINENLPDNFHDPEHVVKKMWYHAVDDSLVVGVKIASLKLSSNDMTLSLLMDRSYCSSFQLIKCQNRVIMFSKDSFPEPYLMSCEVEPEFKKMNDCTREESCSCGQPLKEDSVCILTAITSLSPLLASSKFRGTVLLHISKRESDGYAEDHCIPCGRILLSMEDLSQKTHLLTFPKTNSFEHVEDLLSLLGVLHKYCFYVTSPYLALNLMKMWLLEHVGCEIIREFPQIYMYKKLGIYYETFLHWIPKTAFEGILILYCRNQKLVFHFLHDLIRDLPVNFRYLKCGSEGFLTDHLALALERELVKLGSLSTFASDHDRSRLVQCEVSQEQNSVVFPPPARKDLIHQHRTEVLREGAVMGTNLKVHGTVFTEVTSELVKAQLTSDLAAKKLAYL